MNASCAAPNPACPAIALDGVTKYYGSHPALTAVNLHIAAGEIFGLLGPNGSGKSTLLKLLTGLLVPSAGHIVVHGIDVAMQGREARRQIGYVPEDTPLYPQMRVVEFLAFMAGLKGVAKALVPTAVAQAVELLALAPVTRIPIGRLSHGYRQRVLIAQALLNEPSLLILDEPTNGLDPQQITELRELLKALAPRHTIVLTTHILSEVEKIATRVGILLQGRLRAALVVTAADHLALHALPPAGVDLAALIGSVPLVQIIRPLQLPPPGTAFELRLDAATAREALARRLCDASCPVIALQPVPSPLEAQFLELTAGTAR